MLYTGSYLPMDFLHEQSVESSLSDMYDDV